MAANGIDCLKYAQDYSYFVDEAFNNSVAICKGFFLQLNAMCVYSKIDRPKEACVHLDDIDENNCTCNLNKIKGICVRTCKTELSENVTATGCYCDQKPSNNIVLIDHICRRKPQCLANQN